MFLSVHSMWIFFMDIFAYLLLDNFVTAAFVTQHFLLLLLNSITYMKFVIPRVDSIFINSNVIRQINSRKAIFSCYLVTILKNFMKLIIADHIIYHSAASRKIVILKDHTLNIAWVDGKLRCTKCNVGTPFHQKHFAVIFVIMIKFNRILEFYNLQSALVFL